MSAQRDTVLSALRAEDVARHLGIEGQWRGLWMRSRRCAQADHATEAFAIKRDGHWHCHACDVGGDLLALIATGERLDIRADFPRVLEIAAGIAGVDSDDDEFGAREKPAPKERPALPPQPPLADRIALARRRAEWVWDRLYRWAEVARSRGDGKMMSAGDVYLECRGLSPTSAHTREDIRETPMRVTAAEMAKSAELESLGYLFASPGIALPVRSVARPNELVDIRVRRFEPRVMLDGRVQPKIVGMLGGITAASAEAGRPRQLIGCYGHPAELEDEPMVVVCEGWADYLTALEVWPEAKVLGAVEAGSMALVAAHAARMLAARDDRGRLVIVEQNDRARRSKDGRPLAGAADASVNEDPNAAAKAAIKILGPQRVGWLFCEADADPRVKDLNDLMGLRHAHEIQSMVRWWTEMGQ